ncbi:MAG: catalase [Planctomycetota bacterium]|nr:catalase [Planctomycetota bacterium]
MTNPSREDDVSKPDEKHDERADPRRPRPAERDDKQHDLEKFRQREPRTVLTTDQGIPIPHTDDSLKGGPRGPTLLEDFHLREKITRFDHERIPERVVHARGSGAHGFFQVYESLEAITAARFLCDPTARTPVFVRFSTVVGSRGASDLARDVRGFATKFYTSEGNFDLVGNNMPVFFIQDGLKFPDLVHAVKPEPHNEMPQGASAHDTFWDFVSLVPETMHMVLWVMSDRGLPRSYRMMEGFGVHTFRLVNAAGKAVLCKFHWKPLLGAHAIVWDEAQKISGKDPDFHRRDLWDAIEDGAHPEFELGLQIVDEDDELAYGFDMLDPTKLLPEELVPVRRVGKMTLDRNPQNFFTEVEQVAFCVANVVPGIDFTNDPLLQARLFSYLDTQITRLGGPNFAELPINRPIAPVHNHQQDGSSRTTMPTARALYHPNSIEQNEPVLADRSRGFRHFAERMMGTKNRERSETFLDHFSQARMFLNSQSAPEREHLVSACQFELSKVERLYIRERVIGLFQQIDERFAAEVAAAIGVSTPAPIAVATKVAARAKVGQAPVRSSPALSLANQPKPSIKTRKIALLVLPGFSSDDVDAIVSALCGQGAKVEVVSLALGPVTSDTGRPIDVQHRFQSTASVLFDAVVIPGGSGAAKLTENADAVHFVRECFRHAKPIGATNQGIALLSAAALPEIELAGVKGKASAVNSHGVVTARGADLASFTEALVEAIRLHRHFDRNLDVVPA